MKRFREVFRSEEGFTLIELMIVIAILGILAAVAIPQLTGITGSARATEATNALGTIKSAIMMYEAETGADVSNFAAAASLAGSDVGPYLDDLPDGWTYQIVANVADPATNTADTSSWAVYVVGTSTQNTNIQAQMFETDYLQVNTGTGWRQIQ